MKINLINNSNLKNNKINFSGLWGEKTFKEELFPNVTCWTINYHPYSDETDEFISKVKAENENVTESGDKTTYERVIIGSRLPFTSADADKYIVNKADAKIKALIEDCIDTFRLKI